MKITIFFLVSFLLGFTLNESKESNGSESLRYKASIEEISFKYSRLALVFPLLMEDWQQTLQIRRKPQYYEINPILGKDPTELETGVYFIGSALVLSYLVSILPEVLAASLADTIRYNQRLTLGHNTEMLNGEVYPKQHLSFGIVLTVPLD